MRSITTGINTHIKKKLQNQGLKCHEAHESGFLPPPPLPLPCLFSSLATEIKIFQEQHLASHPTHVHSSNLFFCLLRVFSFFMQANMKSICLRSGSGDTDMNHLRDAISAKVSRLKKKKKKNVLRFPVHCHARTDPTKISFFFFVG